MYKMGGRKRESLSFSSCQTTLRPALLFPLLCEGQNRGDTCYKQGAATLPFVFVSWKRCSY